MKRDLFWADIITRVAQNSAMTYTEAKKLDIDEFFVIVTNYEAKLSRYGKGNARSGSQDKKPGRRSK